MLHVFFFQLMQHPVSPLNVSTLCGYLHFTSSQFIWTQHPSVPQPPHVGQQTSHCSDSTSFVQPRHFSLGGFNGRGRERAITVSSSCCEFHSVL